MTSVMACDLELGPDWALDLQLQSVYKVGLQLQLISVTAHFTITGSAFDNYKQAIYNYKLVEGCMALVVHGYFHNQMYH